MSAGVRATGWTGSQDLFGVVGPCTAYLADDAIDRFPSIDRAALAIHGGADWMTPRRHSRIAATPPHPSRSGPDYRRPAATS